MLSAFLFAALPISFGTAAITLGQARTLQGTHVMAVAAAPTGSKFAATLENNDVRVIDANTGMTIRKFKTVQPAYGIAWNPKGTQIVTGDEGGRVTLWNAATGQKIKEVRPHTKGVQAAFFTRDGSRVLSTGKDDVVKIINFSTGKVEKNILGLGANLYSATPCTGGYVVGTLGGSAQVRKGSASYKLQGHSDGAAFDVDYNPATNRVLSAGRDGQVILFSMVGAKLGAMKGHADWVQHCRFSPNGKYAASSSIDRSVKLWSLTNFACVATIEDQSPVCAPLCFTADGKFLVSASSDDSIQIRALNPPQGAGGRRR